LLCVFEDKNFNTYILFGKYFIPTFIYSTLSHDMYMTRFLAF